MVQEERVPNIFRYSGEYWDATTNLQYLRARWYDPSIGRFINEDTYGGDIKNPLSLNLYTYVENNPLQYIDPTGNSKCAFTETAMECVGNGKGGGGGSAGNSYVGSTVVRGNAYVTSRGMLESHIRVQEVLLLILREAMVKYSNKTF